MSTVVYLSNQQVQIVTGSPGVNRITINECYNADTPDGSIINGMIMDTELFAGFLRDLWANYNLPLKNVVLVINSTKFVAKSIELPVLNEKKTNEFIEREFTDVKKDEDYLLYGYLPIGGENKVRKLYVEAIYPEFIKDYIDIFDEMGVKLSAIYSGESSLIGLVEITLGRKYKTFILQVAERMTLTSMLFVNGSFYYFNSSRCFHEQGSLDYANDIARSVSQIIQFMQAHQLEYQLEAVCLAGIDPYAFPLYREAIYAQGVSAPIEVFSDGSIYADSKVDIQNSLRGAGGLVQFDKNTNFLRAYSNAAKHKKKDKDGPDIKNLIGVFVTLAIMLIGFAISATAATLKKKELNKIKDYNEDPVNMMEAAKYEALVLRNSFLASQFDAITDIDENLKTYPLGNDVVMNKIYDCALGYADVEFESFDADAGRFGFTATADSVDNINLFIKELMKQDIFSDIEYTGYSYQEASKTWDIHVDCILNEAAGR